MLRSSFVATTLICAAMTQASSYESELNYSYTKLSRDGWNIHTYNLEAQKYAQPIDTSASPYGLAAYLQRENSFHIGLEREREESIDYLDSSINTLFAGASHTLANKQVIIAGEVGRGAGEAEEDDISIDTRRTYVQIQAGAYPIEQLLVWAEYQNALEKEEVEIDNRHSDDEYEREQSASLNIRYTQSLDNGMYVDAMASRERNVYSPSGFSASLVYINTFNAELYLNQTTSVGLGYMKGSFDDVSALIYQAEHFVTPRLGLSASYTDLSYDDVEPGDDKTGNIWSFAASYRF